MAFLEYHKWRDITTELDADSIILNIEHLIETGEINNLQTALDLGCGYGYLMNRLKEKGIKVFGVDLRKLKSNNLIIADVRFLPFASNSFNLVTDSYLLSDMSNLQKLCSRELEKVISETHRVLKPGGVFITKPREVNADQFFRHIIYEDQTWGGIYKK